MKARFITFIMTIATGLFWIILDYGLFWLLTLIKDKGKLIIKDPCK